MGMGGSRLLEKTVGTLNIYLSSGGLDRTPCLLEKRQQLAKAPILRKSEPFAWTPNRRIRTPFLLIIVPISFTSEAPSQWSSLGSSSARGSRPFTSRKPAPSPRSSGL